MKKGVCAGLLSLLVFPMIGWCATTVTFSGTSQVEDLMLVTGNGDAVYYNAGGNVSLSVGYFTNLGGNTRSLIRFLGLDTLAGNRITKATLTLTYSGHPSQTQNTTVELYQVASANVDWIEGTNTGFDWDGSGVSTWGFKHSYSDGWAGGVWSGCGVAGTDYVSSLLDSKIVTVGTASGTTVSFNIPVSVVQSWVDNYATGQKNPGLFLRDSTDGSPGYQVLFCSSETSSSPRLVVTYFDSDVATKPIFTPSGKYISGPTAISMTSETPGAVIYYTIDGSTPTVKSTKYTQAVTVSGGTTLQAIAVLGSSISDVTSQTYEFYPIVEKRTGTIETAANSLGMDLVLQNGSIHVNGNRYKHIVLAGTISNWSSNVASDGTGIWSYISMLGTDYFNNREVPANVDETMNVFSYVGNTNYGNEGKQRGFAANGGLVLWKGAQAYGVNDGFAAEDCFPDPLGGHSTNLSSNMLTDPSQFEYEIAYDLESMELTVKIRDIGDTDWDGEGSAVLGCRNDYSVSAFSDDWSDLVFSIQSCNSLISDTATYGFDYTIQMQIYGITSGDANLDGAVNVSDLSLLAANYGTTSGATWAKGDFTGDGAVNVSDLSLLAANYGTGSTSTMSWADAYAQVLGTTSDADETSDAWVDDSENPVSSVCSSLGLSLIAGLALMGLMIVKLEE